MLVSFIRRAIETNGGIPQSYEPVEAVRELVTAYGATPESYQEIALWRQAVSAVGGTPTQHEPMALIRELVGAMGVPAPSFKTWELGEQLAGASASAPTDVPEQITPPAITASSSPLIPGVILTASGGTFTNGPFTRARQWYADGEPISGATGSTYELTEGDVGVDEITHGVVATNVVGSSDEALSNPVGPVEAEPVDPPEEITAPILTLISGATLKTSIDTVDEHGAVVGDFFELRIFADEAMTDPVDGSPELQEFTSPVSLGAPIEWECLVGLAPGPYWGDVCVVRDPEGAAQYSDRSPLVSADVWPSITKLVAEGDSITAEDVIGYVHQWATAHPWVPVVNCAVGGSNISTLEARIAATMANDPSHLTILIGANDLGGSSSSETPAEYVERLFDLVAAYKAVKPSLIVGVATILPIDEDAPTNAGKSGFNARRAIANSLIAAGVGTHFDFLIPFGEAFTDADALDPELTDDGLHWLAPGYAKMVPGYTAALEPFTPEEPDIGVAWSTVTGADKNRYVDVDVLDFEVSADVYANAGVRANAPAVPDLFQFEITATGIADAVRLGLIDSATAVDTTPPTAAVYPIPGASSVPGLTVQMSGGWNRMQVWANNTVNDYALPGAGNAAVGDTTIIRGDRTTDEVWIYYMRAADTSATLIATVTLAATAISGDWFGVGSGLMDGDAGTANFGSAPFRMALSDGFEPYRGTM